MVCSNWHQLIWANCCTFRFGASVVLTTDRTLFHSLSIFNYTILGNFSAGPAIPIACSAFVVFWAHFSHLHGLTILWCPASGWSPSRSWGLSKQNSRPNRLQCLAHNVRHALSIDIVHTSIPEERNITAKPLERNLSVSNRHFLPSLQACTS